MEISMVELIAGLVAVVYTIPIGWLFFLYNRQGRRIDEMQKTSYTKEETEKMIELHNRPVLVAMEGIKADVSEIKLMIGRLFDAQAKS